MADSADNNSVSFQLKQDAIIAGPQSIGHIGSAKVLDVAVQPGFQSFNLAQDLLSDSFGQGIQIIQCGGTVLDPITAVIHRGVRFAYPIASTITSQAFQPNLLSTI
jgi:hypothetical protein